MTNHAIPNAMWATSMTRASVQYAIVLSAAGYYIRVTQLVLRFVCKLSAVGRLKYRALTNLLNRIHAVSVQIVR